MKTKNKDFKEVFNFKNKGKQNTNEMDFMFENKPDFRIPKFNRKGRVKR